MAEGNIKQIDRTSVHKICSGQVVLTLATAVKELVENSIDAGATIIEVKLEEHGSKIIEVIDNGKGVKTSDFQSLTLKHHTSKIADFADVPFVSTFGFRGEALSSLCALSDLEVTTRHLESTVGTTLSFDHNGLLVKSTPTHRQIGTTVTLKNIFFTFPVRHREFLRHIRKEYLKMIQLLTAYCLISVNKRITCSNVNEKGKKTVVLSTNSFHNIKDNIISIFGDKQIKQLMEIVQYAPSKDVLEEYFLPESATETSKAFRLEGYVSNSNHGEGRSASDRQFYFISGRPCDLPKVSKVINEVYHSFNKNQYPFVFMNIILGEGCADVNVTPDKRQVFIPDEKVLLALIKTTLLRMYGKQPSQMTASLLLFEPLKKKSEASTLCLKPCDPLDSSLKRKLESSIHSEDEENPLPPSFKSQKLVDSPTENNNAQPSDSPAQNESLLLVTPEPVVTSSVTELNMELNPSTNGILSNADVKPSQIQHNNNTSAQSVNFALTLTLNEDKLFKKMSPKKSGSYKLSEILALARRSSKLTPQACANSISRKSSKIIMNGAEADNKVIDYFERLSTHKVTIRCDVDKEESSCTENENIELIDTHQNSIEEESDEISKPKNSLELSLDEPFLHQRKYRTVLFTMEMLGNKPQIKDDQNEYSEKCAYRKFRSKIIPTENQNAEEELKKEINKDSFSEMEVIGQFNLGFIIARLHDDLFIIDQHATDEKYNFEQLQMETVLETQQLLQPQLLNLTAVSEAIILDNLHIFEMNGFKFKINEDNPSGERVQLVSVPVSHNWRFGKEDVDELVFMLTDNPIRMVRPSRVNQMFASRACRKSIMIGTALTKPMMKKLITHMGEIDQPWNCPHGRPTIRHLFNLNLLKPI